jgi:hypothetical protein
MRRIRSLLIALLSTLGALAPPAHANGLACEQDCSSGACLQAACGQPASGSGFCDCSSGALPWGGDTFAAYCRGWGQPGPGCAQQVPAGDGSASQLANTDAMSAAVAGQNPYVATLLLAMQGRNGWAGGPVQGLFHDSHYDATAGRLSHTTALAFVGTVTMTGGVAQIDVTVTGDLTRLGWLKQYSDALATGAVLPQSIHGTVSAGGLHGSLLAAGAGGQSQTIQW